MTDIVERLKDMSSDSSHAPLRYEKDKRLASEAAAEIERLERELENLVGRLAAREHDLVSMTLELDQMAQDKDRLLDVLKEIEERTRPQGDMADQAVNELCVTALKEKA